MMEERSNPKEFNLNLVLQEESFHLVDNRPVKANKFGGRGGRFSAASRLQQQRAVREAGAKGQPEVQKGGKMSLQAQRKQPWQNYGRENQRVGAMIDVETKHWRNPQLLQACWVCKQGGTGILTM